MEKAQKNIMIVLGEKLRLLNDRNFNELVNAIEDKDKGSLTSKSEWKKDLIEFMVGKFFSLKAIKEVEESEAMINLKRDIENLYNVDDLADSSFYVMLHRLNDNFDKIVSAHYAKYIIESFKIVQEQLDSITLKNILSNKSLMEPSRVRNTISTLLMEMHNEIKTKTKLEVKGKYYITNTCKAKLEEVDTLYVQLRNDILSDKYYVDTKAILEDVKTLMTKDIDLLNKFKSKAEGYCISKEEYDAKHGKKTAEQKKDAEKKELVLQREQRVAKVTKGFENIKAATKKRWKALAAAGILIVGFGTGLFIGHSLVNNDKNDTPKDPSGYGTIVPGDDESPETVQDGEEVTEEAKTVAKTVYANWKALYPDMAYTEDDILELVKFLNGIKSSIDADIADRMLLDILNVVTAPAVNNAINGTEPTKAVNVDVSSLLINDQKGLEAIKNMETNLNGAINNPTNFEEYANDALVDEVGITTATTVDGLNVNPQSEECSTPSEILLWSRLAVNANAIYGTLGEDYSFTEGGLTYEIKDLTDYAFYENLATLAKKDLGTDAKTLHLN